MKNFIKEKAERLADRIYEVDKNSNPTVAVHPCQNKQGGWMVAVDYFINDGEGGYMPTREVVGWIE